MGQAASHSILKFCNPYNLSISVGALIYALYRICSNYRYQKARKNCNKKIIFVTGCDSGLGVKLAAHARKLGFTVFVSCLNTESDGAKMLQTKWPDVNILEMDVSSIDSIKNAINAIEDFLKNNEDHVLWSVINNVGILVFGEFEWQTEEQIFNQLSLNTLGTMRVTKKILPLLRLSRNKMDRGSPRIIAISSHCAYESLPGISTYAASKAALVAWLDGLRCEIRPHGLCVSQIIPGRVNGTKIMSNTRSYSQEMWEEMTEEQRDYYGEQFERYYAYLDGAGTNVATFPSEFDDSERQLREAFERALFDKEPKRKYICEPWQYTIYRIFAAISPTIAIRDYATIKFVRTPQWKQRGK